MADWSLIGDGQQFSTEGETASTSRGTTLTSGAANAKGSYSQLVASSSFAATFIIVHLKAITSAASLVDIAVGAAASEQVIIPNLLFSVDTIGFPITTVFMFPVSIPSGTRIAARLQSNGASNTLDAVVTLLVSGFIPSAPLSVVTDYGIVTTDSGGTSVDPGGTANTKGAWSEITASSNKVDMLSIVFGNQLNAAMATAHWLFDIGIGAAGSETILIPDLMVSSDVGDDRLSPVSIGPIPVNIPAATRIAVRSQCDIIDATDRLLDVALYGIR